MGRSLLVAAATFSCALTVSAKAEDFNNDSVMALTKAQIGTSVLLAKIASLPCSYDVSTNSIIALKSAGVAEPVIAAMVDRCLGSAQAQGAVAAASDPTAKRTPGLYIDLGTDSVHRLERIRPTMGSGGRMTGNGSLLFPFRMKLAVPRAAATTVVRSSLPTFYFYFEADDAKVGDFGTSATAAAQSPTEFSLVRFKGKDGQREMVVAKQQMFGGSVGIDPKEAIQFSVSERGDNIFQVAPQSPLEPGEYGFVIRAGSDAYRIYDFSVSTERAVNSAAQ